MASAPGTSVEAHDWSRAPSGVVIAVARQSVLSNEHDRHSRILVRVRLPVNPRCSPVPRTVVRSR